MPETSKKYTDAEKLAYYKAKAKKAGSAAKKKSKGSFRQWGRSPSGFRSVGGAVVYPNVFTGRGDYMQTYAQLGNELRTERGGDGAGSFLGRVGQSAGNALSHWLGLGAYSVSKNSLLTDPMPVINKSEGGACTIRHREYIGDIISAATPNTFKIQSFPINPAMESTFPWLSQIAANFEQYRIEGMIFEFRTMSADALNSVNTALGQVIMATDYNAANPPFAQKSEMENYEYGQSAKPSESAIHPIECARLQTTISELYTRAGAVPLMRTFAYMIWATSKLPQMVFKVHRLTAVSCGSPIKLPS